MKHRNDLGLNISLIKGEDGIAKCFCVTLIRNPSSPFDTSKPIPATVDLLLPPGGQVPQNNSATQGQSKDSSMSAPAFMAG